MICFLGKSGRTASLIVNCSEKGPSEVDLKIMDAFIVDGYTLVSVVTIVAEDSLGDGSLVSQKLLYTFVSYPSP